MAFISQKDVEHVAELAKLELNETEKTIFAGQLSQILTFVGHLQQVSTEGVPPTASVADQELNLREDVPRPCLSLEDAMVNAPHSADGFFVVPKILGK